MKLSRVSNFKEYRESFTNENAYNMNGKKDIISGLKDNKDPMSTTNTLPYEMVMQEMKSQNKMAVLKEKQLFKRIAIISLIAIVAIGVIVGLIFLGILAFKG